jgi:hypothetical protein
MTNIIARGMPAIAAAFVIAIGGMSCAPRTVGYFGPDPERLLDPSLSALCLPVTVMRVENIDNTQLRPNIQFSDSFLQNAVSGLILYEVAKKFKIGRLPAGSLDSMEKPSRARYSVLAQDSADKLLVSKLMRETAAKHAVDFIVLPYAVYVKERTVKPASWRDDEGPGYDRPVSITAETSVHIQIWDKNGRLIFERIGQSSRGQPVLYSWLKQKKTDRDIVTYARRLYASPLIKSLYASVVSALPKNRDKELMRRARRPQRFGE